MDGDGPGVAGDLEREVERLSGDVLDGRVPSADAPGAASTPAVAATPLAASTAPVPDGGSTGWATGHMVDQLLVGSRDPIATGLEGISGDLARIQAMAPDRALPLGDVEAAASAQRVVDAVVAGLTGTPGDTVGDAGASAGDELRTVAAMSTNASAALEEPPGGGVVAGTTRSRALAVAGMAVVALAAFVGALLVLQGGGPAGPGGPTDLPAMAQASGDAASAGAGGALTEATPTPSPTPAPTPAATETPSPTAPSPSASSPAPGVRADATPAAGASRTFRGTVDVRAFEKTGLDVGEHGLELVVFTDTGRVTGTVTLELPEFPIGAILTRLFAGDRDQDYARFKRCTVRLVMAGRATGTYRASTGALKGKVVFRPTTDDVHACLKTRPSNVTINAVTKPSTVTWTGKVTGDAAKGRLATEPAMGWSAVAE